MYLDYLVDIPEVKEKITYRSKGTWLSSINMEKMRFFVTFRVETTSKKELPDFL